jgi:hypothetical protein
MLAGEVAIVHRLDFAAFISGHIAALLNPAPTLGGKSLRGITIESRISPGATAVIDADRIIGLQLSGEILGRGECNLAHRDVHLGMQSPLYVDSSASGELFPAGVIALQF